MSKKSVKQSLLIGALTSSFGIFLTKLLGLFYYSPLSTIAGESNMALYAITYTDYDLLLKISSAGIPFAIAALVARYYAKEDYKTVLLVKKLGYSLVLGLSLLCGIVFLIFSGDIAAQSLGSFASVEDIENLKTLFYILIFAVILVPFLSALRGYYQGLKRLDLYASSQVFEQLIRVCSIVFFAYLFVRVMHMKSIWAVFMAMAAAGLAALATIIYIKFFTKEDDTHINELVKNQTTDGETYKTLFKEILALGIPYLVIAFLGSTSALINTTYFLQVATNAGMDIKEAKLSLGILQANCNKLGSIPQVLTLGFSSGLVPYLTESLEKGEHAKLNKQVIQILDTVNYILIPVTIIFVFFAKDIYFIMFGYTNLDLGAHLFRISCIIIVTDTIAPILSSMMITLKLRKQSIITLAFSLAIKLITFFTLVEWFYAEGMVYSTAISSLFVIVIYIIIIRNSFNLRFKGTFNKLFRVIVASIIMVLPAVLIHNIIPFNYNSRLFDVMLMMGLGLIMLVIYYYVSVAFKLPQEIFNIKEVSIRKLLKRFRQ